MELAREKGFEEVKADFTPEKISSAPPIENHILFTVRKGGKISYLLGTIHALPGGCRSLSGSLFSQLYASQLLLVEIIGRDEQGDMYDEINFESCLIREARNKMISVQGLETVAERETILFGMRNLWGSAKSEEARKKDWSTTLACYRAGDLDCFAREAWDADEYEYLIKMRNELWMKRLVPVLQNGDVFVAVGVGHLVGPSALQSLLEKEGFEVRRVLPNRQTMGASTSLNKH